MHLVYFNGPKLTCRINLLGIGFLGSIQNVVAAGARQKPGALGFHITLIDVITGPRVTKVIKEVEEKFLLVGSSLVPVYFPGKTRMHDDEDISFWRKAQELRFAPNRWETRIDNLPQSNTVEESTRGLFREGLDA